jgi:hypothetical protein
VYGGRSRGLQDDANGIGPVDGFTNLVNVPLVSGAQVLTVGLYDMMPLDGTINYSANGVYSLGSTMFPSGTMGKPFSLPAGSRIVRVDTLGIRNTVGQQFWFIHKRNLFAGSAGSTIANFQSPAGTGEVQASHVANINVVAGDLYIIEIGDTSINNRAVGATIQYIPPTAPTPPPTPLPGDVATGPSFYPITPTRVYDSRAAAPSPGMLAPGAARVVSVKDGRDGTGAVNSVDIVPADATAVVFNVTVTGATGPNYLSVAPGDTASVSASTINWGGGYDIANGGTVKLDISRQVKAFMGDQPGSAHFIIDISGYYK